MMTQNYSSTKGKASVEKIFDKPKYEPHIVINLRRDLKEERQKREEAEKRFDELKKTIKATKINEMEIELHNYCLLYTSPSPRDS